MQKRTIPDETPRTTPQIVAGVHCKLIMDQLDRMHLSGEKRREILERVILAIGNRAEVEPPTTSNPIHPNEKQ